MTGATRQERQDGIGWPDHRVSAHHHPYLFPEGGEVYVLCIRGARLIRERAWDRDWETWFDDRFFGDVAS